MPASGTVLTVHDKGVYVSYHGSLYHDDIVGIVHEVLLRAAHSFDPSKGVPFASYGWLRGMGHLKSPP